MDSITITNQLEVGSGSSEPEDSEEYYNRQLELIKDKKNNYNKKGFIFPIHSEKVKD